MPLYDFSCRTCGHIFEIFESVEEVDEPKKYCPKCKRKRKVDYIFSRTAPPIFVAGVGGFAGHTVTEDPSDE